MQLKKMIKNNGYYFLIAIILSLLISNKKYFLYLYKPLQFVLNERFGDLNSFLHALDYFKKGGNPYFDKLGDQIALYNYPSFFRVFSLIPGFSAANLRIIGVSIIFLCLFFCLKILNPTKILDYSIFAIVVFSPAFILAFERANTDLIVFIIISTSIVLYKKQITSNSLIVFAGLLKLFPVAGIANLLATPYNRKRKILLFSFYCIVFCAYLYIIKDEIILILKNTPYDINNFCFGLKIIPEIIIKNYSFNKFEVYTFFLLLIALLAYFFIFSNFSSVIS